MKNRKGEVGLQFIIGMAVAVIFALVIFQQSAANVAQTSNTRTLSNGTYTAPANLSYLDLVGQELLDTPIVTNASSGAVVAAANYTIAEGVSSVDGLKRIRLYSTGQYAGLPVNISYAYGPEGYIADSAGRSVAALIIIFAALAIAVVALPSIKDELGI